MNTRRFIAISGLVGLWLHAADPVAGEPASFDHYHVIIETSPFGGIATGPGAEVLPNFAERYQFVGHVPGQADDGVLAVLFDTERNRTELVPAGGVFGEVELVEIDINDQSPKIIIQKGLESATLRMKSREEALAASAKNAIAPTKGTAPAPVRPGVVTPNPTTTGDSSQDRIVMPRRRRIPFRRGD